MEGSANGDASNPSNEAEALIENTLYRYTSGMPRRELDMMVQESIECETLLLQDIDALEKALSGDQDCPKESVKAILESQLTPLDRFWSASALMGRLRNDMQVVPPPNSLALEHTTGGTRGPKRIDDERRLQGLLNDNMKLYSEEMISNQTMLGLWKKISSSKTALVFKKPVRDEEAPGYSDRIKFPIDLSLIRKRIVANDIQTFESFHAAIGLISHNCVKYNGTS
jgi:Bromodomain